MPLLSESPGRPTEIGPVWSSVKVEIQVSTTALHRPGRRGPRRLDLLSTWGVLSEPSVRAVVVHFGVHGIGVVDHDVRVLPWPDRSEVEPLAGDVPPAVALFCRCGRTEDGPITLSCPPHDRIDIGVEQDAKVPAFIELRRSRKTRSTTSTASGIASLQAPCGTSPSVSRTPRPRIADPPRSERQQQTRSESF
jgi:hypothetical protein